MKKFVISICVGLFVLGGLLLSANLDNSSNDVSIERVCYTPKEDTQTGHNDSIKDDDGKGEDEIKDQNPHEPPPEEGHNDSLSGGSNVAQFETEDGTLIEGVLYAGAVVLDDGNFDRGDFDGDGNEDDKDSSTEGHNES